MSHMVETMAYAGQKPWHGLGEKVSQDMSPAQMLKAAKLDWTVSKRQMYFKTKTDKEQTVDGASVLIRDSDETVLSTVGATYKPVQNALAFEFFQKFTDAGHMKMETAGSLADGKYVWALARLAEDFNVGKGDAVIPYLLLCSPHIYGKSLIMQYTPTRVVCWNTLSMALGANMKGGSSAFRMPHSQSFEVKREEAEGVLKLCIAQNNEFKEAAKVLSKKKVSKEKADEFFCTLLGFDPRDSKGKDAPKRVPVMLPKFRESLTHAPGAQLSTAAGTWWGAVGAVTYVIDHETGRERTTALRNAWIGHTSTIKRRALSLALDMAK